MLLLTFFLDEEAVNYEEAVLKTGYGKFHYILLLICGWANASDAIEVRCIVALSVTWLVTHLNLSFIFVHIYNTYTQYFMYYIILSQLSLWFLIPPYNKKLGRTTFPFIFPVEASHSPGEYLCTRAWCCGTHGHNFPGWNITYCQHILLRQLLKKIVLIFR